jgi:N-acyl homoserine lactone hydrolase
MILQGRPTHLYVLDFGLFRVHQNGRVIGIPGFVIRTDAGEVVLVDGGFPAKYARDPEASSREDRLGDFGEVLQCAPQNRPEAQLALIGLAPQDITHCLLTHSHIDHIGALDSFGHAPMILAAAERALPKPLYWGEQPPMDWPERTYIPLHSDSVIGPGFQVLQTPGHTPGQISVRITLPDTSPVLIASDALSRPAELQTDFSDAMDPKRAVQSAQRLDRIARDNAGLMIYGHCPDQWPRLRKAPDGYQ